MNGRALVRDTAWLVLALLAGAGVGLVVRAGSAGARAGRRATLLYPRAEGLRFDHGKHKGMTCTRCHSGVERSISASDRNIPREAVCRACHAKSTRRDDSPTERQRREKGCAKCHRGFDPKDGRPPARVRALQGRVRFSHRLHKDKGVGCASCHDMGRPSKSMPTMASCLSCHSTRKATTRCASCHVTGKDGRLLTRFGGRKLLPSGNLKGDAHTPGFAKRHKQVARGNKRYCEQCHAPHTCLKCHQGTYRPMSIHPNDYATHHALDAKLRRNKCQSCHRAQTFCISCHQRSGVAQSSVQGGFKPNTGLRFHPDGWSARSIGPNHHAFKARRNIRVCASCHQEKTCIRCHGTRQLGNGGFSPHGANFAHSARCRALAARNQRVCLKCHQPGDRKINCL
ncbi:MAG: hypothetical protein KC503_21120 [Myxococcales bacterium]|nr:hypothetical protein [Myxococcales bacterium]